MFFFTFRTSQILLIASFNPGAFSVHSAYATLILTLLLTRVKILFKRQSPYSKSLTILSSKIYQGPQQEAKTVSEKLAIFFESQSWKICIRTYFNLLNRRRERSEEKPRGNDPIKGQQHENGVLTKTVGVQTRAY